MTTDHFAAFIRHRTVGSRRTLVGLGAGSGLITLLGIEAKTKKRKKRCKKKCSLCQQCKKGKCRTTPDGASCRYGACQGGVCTCTGDEDCPSACFCGSGSTCISSDIPVVTDCANCPEGTVSCFDFDHANFACHVACTA